MTRIALSDKRISEAKPKPKPYRLWDTRVPGLFVRVQPSGAKTFNVQWDRANSRALGRFPRVAVSLARTSAKRVLAEVARSGAPEARKSTNRVESFAEFLSGRYAPWIEVERKSGRACVANLRAQFGFLMAKPLPEITSWSIEKFKAERLKSGISGATVNRDLDRIRAALSKAVEWGLITANPVSPVKRARNDAGFRVRYLSPDEETRLLGSLATTSGESGLVVAGEAGSAARFPAVMAARQRLAVIVTLALNTGLRRGELFSLAWSDINLTLRQVEVRAQHSKTGRARHVPLNDHAVAIMTRWRIGADLSGLVFPGANGIRLTNFNRSWSTLAAKAKLRDFRFHDCRHHFASRLVMAGVDLYTVKELLGHSDFAMTQRYAHLSNAHKAAAVGKLLA